MGMPHVTGPSQMKMARTRKGGDDAFYGIGGRKRVRHRQSLPYSVLYPIYYPVAEGKAYFDLDNLQENGLPNVAPVYIQWLPQFRVSSLLS